jgi:hydrogenase/urease accessory protein HupE
VTRLLAATALLIAVSARAHPLAPSLLDVHERGDGRIDVTWKAPLVRPRGAALEPVLPTRCRPVGASTTGEENAGLVTRWVGNCGPGPLVGEAFGVTGFGSIGLAALVRVALADGRVVEGVVSAARPTLVVPARPSTLGVVRDYVRLGVEHILTGPDHLLFVFGLLLLAGTVRRLLATVTAFTVGHSITLTLAALGIVDLPSRPIEAAIAASVLLLAVELARRPTAPTLMRRYPWAMAATFGLLHGLGFAAALREAGLPAGEIPLALFSFNVGIETGQLAFVLVVLAAARALRGVPTSLPAWTRWVPVYTMGSLAASWWIERTAAWLW